MLELPLWQLILRIVVLYLCVMLALRFMGKREIGQLSVFDFVVSVMIAELSTVPMEDTQVPLLQSVFCIGALVVLQILVAVLQLKSHRFRHWVEGEPTVLIEHGHIRDKEMARARYTMHDLLTQLREKGFTNVADVEFAILETSGELSVFPRAERQPLTPADAGIAAEPVGMPMPLVVDGQIVGKTLTQIGQDRSWLESELKRRGYGQIQDVMYAAIDRHGRLHIDVRDAPDLQRSDGEREALENARQSGPNTRDAGEVDSGEDSHRTK
ncbi:MAG: DUF421 domain-containing protein [Alicyclobacillus herbarius]|uniref:DUF421 domain-containing protein n=1 Tax=Alicyclobacillus herbarius TaxID=122960 RepID=UPI002353899E|nr:DUF421 domain-containing protein [Alicyclobacillus herbarius]MCL6632324.1 DUF421 domain-containing protein [Alicyclobacillus herbarius]